MSLRAILEQAGRLWEEWRDVRDLAGDALIAEVRRVFEGRKERA